ncbi:hypothetical protein [Xanthomonas dyei]|uniref:hypothetical protein n=1 Tax=Xanthomonas dyei TaxID=743699 RepID=UPI001EE85F31|nr:hypothetical protein [Xanthomonas dyei]
MRNPLNALEEPLAIYWGQYRFEHAVRGRALPRSLQWYIQADADRAAKAIAAAYPASEAAPLLDDSALLAAAASVCKQAEMETKADLGDASPAEYLARSSGEWFVGVEST